MIRVKELKFNKIIAFVSAGITGVLAILTLSLAAKIQERVPYFQPKEIKNAIAFLTVIGILAVNAAAISFGMAVGIWMLEKKGIVCPQCRRVYSRLKEICPKCNCDLSHAQNVKEALASGPIHNDKRMAASVKQNFCTICGAKLGNDTLFCPRCGKKLAN